MMKYILPLKSHWPLQVKVSMTSLQGVSKVQEWDFCGPDKESDPVAVKSHDGGRVGVRVMYE
jgi:hypothetical protein